MKKIINKFILNALALGFSFYANAQDPKNDIGRISLSTYIAPQVEQITPGAAGIISNKLNQMVSANGLASGYSRFIIVANLNVISKDIVAGAPPMTAIAIEVTLCIGDGIDGNKFSSYSMTVKGVGINENKALMEAFKSINPKNAALQDFLTKGKNQIVAYYDSRCGQILKEANLLEAQNRFEEAIYKLTSVPNASLECYNKAIEAVVPIYKKYIDRDCRIKLQEAAAIWNANQNADAANAVGEIIIKIDPQSVCYADVTAFSDKVAKRVLELDNREWKYKIDTEIGLKRDLIQAYRDVGVAYGNGQPKTVVYNVRGWF